MASMQELLVQYEIEYARRASLILDKLSGSKDTPFPFIAEDIQKAAETWARFCIDEILNGVEKLERADIAKCVVDFSQVEPPIKEKALKRGKKSFDFLRYCMQHKGEYGSWKHGIKAIFPSGAEYIKATNPRLLAVQAQIAATIQYLKSKGDQFDPALLTKGFKAYKGARNSIAYELYPELKKKSAKSKKTISILKIFGIDYTFDQKDAEGNYQPVCDGYVNDVLEGKTEKHLLYLGMVPADGSALPALQGDGIANEQGYVQVIKGNLVYTHLTNEHATEIRGFDKKVTKIEAPTDHIIAKPDFDKTHGTLFIYVGPDRKYQLQLDFFAK